MTFSIAARCPRTGMFGVAITTASLCVGARCPFVRAGFGAVLTQNRTDPRLGPRGLDLLASGLSAQQVLDDLVQSAHVPGWRQLAIVDRQGRTAFFSGGDIVSRHGGYEGEGCVSIGNLLVRDELPRRMVEGFLEEPDSHIADRLIAALIAGLDAGGETSPVRSAAILVADRYGEFPDINLRVDDHDDPVTEVKRIWQKYQPQHANFMLRVEDPGAAI